MTICVSVGYGFWPEDPGTMSVVPRSAKVSPVAAPIRSNAPRTSAVTELLAAASDRPVRFTAYPMTCVPPSGEHGFHRAIGADALPSRDRKAKAFGFDTGLGATMTTTDRVATATRQPPAWALSR